jgi:AcrR family transcriptional regulator
MSQTLPPADTTPARLLEAAGEIFAQRGYQRATVRAICERAGANMAAVHYHFGDKHRLYRAVLKDAHLRALERFPPLDPALASAPADRRLAYFVSQFLRRLLDQSRPDWPGQLVARELVDPTPALDALVGDVIRPQAQLLAGIVRELLGPLSDERQLRFAMFSVISQCVFHHHARAVIGRLFPEQGYEPADLEALADHIAQLCLDGFAAARSRRQGAR